MKIHSNQQYKNVHIEGSAQKTGNVSFRGLYLWSCIRDLRMLRLYGEEAKNRLPNCVKNADKKILGEVIQYIKSTEFANSVASKNWIDKDEITWSMAFLKQKDFLKERSDILLTKTYLILKDLYKKTNEVVIPFSGGRDSTGLLSASLAFFPNKKYKLVTVLNGMSERQENVINQAKYIIGLFSQNGKKKLKVEHIFIDASDNMKKHVIDTAKKDEKIIKAPAVCSGCKIIMEKEIWSFLLNKKQTFLNRIFKRRPSILMGYTTNQRNQNWMEQTKVQMDTMEKESTKFGLKSFSPLISIIEEPYDSTLLLGALGIPLKNHKREMKCLAGGLNPKKLNNIAQTYFTNLKNKQTEDIPLGSNPFIYYNPNGVINIRTDLREQIKQLAADSDFKYGAF